MAYVYFTVLKIRLKLDNIKILSEAVFFSPPLSWSSFLLFLLFFFGGGEHFWSDFWAY